MEDSGEAAEGRAVLQAAAAGWERGQMFLGDFSLPY